MILQLQSQGKFTKLNKKWENQWSLSFSISTQYHNRLSYLIDSRLDMCRCKTRHGECNRGTAVFAYVGGACVVNKRLEKNQFCGNCRRHRRIFKNHCCSTRAWALVRNVWWYNFSMIFWYWILHSKSESRVVQWYYSSSSNVFRLGAVHDGSPPPSYLGGPGARKCRWKDGFIMSDLRHTSKGFRWSHCTVKQFRHFLK